MTHMLGVLVVLWQVSANSELGYRLTLPDGFEPFPEGHNQKDVVDCWSEVTPVSPNGALILCVHRMHAALRRERMKQRDVPGSATQLVTFKWRGFDIDGMRTDTTQGGAPVVVFVAQVPLRREAVQLVVAGPGDQATRAEAIMSSTLGTLEGETNWLTDAERAGRLGNIVGWALGIGVAVIVIRIWRGRRRARAA